MQGAASSAVVSKVPGWQKLAESPMRACYKGSRTGGLAARDARRCHAIPRSHTSSLALAQRQRIPACSQERLGPRLRPALQIQCRRPNPAGHAGDGVFFRLQLCRHHEQEGPVSCGMHHAWPQTVLVKGRSMLTEVACEVDSSLRAFAASRFSLDV